MDRVPVLKIGDILLVSIQIDLEDQTAMQLQSDLSDRIVETGARMRLVGVNRSGLEYAEPTADGFLDGAGVTAGEIAEVVRVWQARIIRLPFNQDFAINGRRGHSAHRPSVFGYPARGCEMYGSPDWRVCPACAASENR